MNVKKYAKSDDRVKVFHKENGGASSARNFGISKATGNYFVFIDADDWVDNDYIERLIGAFDNNIDMVICDRQFELKSETKADIHFFQRHEFLPLKKKAAN